MNANVTNTEVVDVIFNEDVVVVAVAAVAMVAVVAALATVAMVAIGAVTLDTLDFNTNSSFVCNT